MAEANEQTTTQAETTQQQTTSTADDATFYRAEAQKAFKARDELKAKLREFESKVLSDEDRELFATLKDQQAKAEEDRQKKAGEWEALKQQQKERIDQQQRDHQKQLAERDALVEKERNRRRAKSIAASFGAATDYFSGSDSKTVLDVTMAIDVLGKYVSVEDDEADPSGERIVVKKPNGDIIFGSDGNPAEFSEAIGELIKLLPSRDRILRGSGKTGSGNSGGLTGGRDIPDLRNLTPDQRRDPKILAALKASLPRGGVVMGEAYNA